ncbi:MAG TPA: PAS domain S-box protein [Pseudolabrys sp.]|jgi:PAS domain S-box-containing protein|nr:PAS domain S-box protein [Pseudolabrys sp.]
MSLNEISAVALSSTINVRRDNNAAVFKTPPEFIDMLPVAIYACDGKGRVLWFNRQAAKLWGRAPRVGDDAEMFCGSHKLYLNGRLIAREETPMATVLRTGEPIHGVEEIVERPDGSRVWVTVHIDPFKNDVGEILGAISCFHDTTATHEAQAALQQHQKDLEDFFDNAAVGMHLVDPDGTILRANRSELDLLGYEASEYIGRNIKEFHVDESEVNDILGRLSDREQVDKYPARMRAKDGSIRDVLISSSAQFRDGKFVNTRCITLDVTSWKKANEELAEQHQRFAATYEHADIGITEVDAAGRHLRANKAACEILGLPREKLVGSSPYEMMTATDAKYDRDQHERMVAGDLDRYTAHSRYIRPDGKVVWIDMVGSAVRNAQGRFLYSVRVFKDVTAAKETAQALAESRRRLIATYENAGVAISEVDENGRLLHVNEAACKITGYSREELLKLSVFDVTHPEDREPDIERFRQQVDAPGQPKTIEKRLIRKDGRIVWVAITSSTIRDAEGQFLYGIRVMQDITDRRRADEKLRDSEHRFRELIEALPAAVYTTDAKGRITFYNHAAIELSGRRPVIGSDRWCITWKLYNTDGSFLRHDQCPMAIALKEGRPVRGIEAIAERPDGTRVPFIPYPTPLRNSDGEIVGAVNMLVDISERKQSETSQRVLLDELNHRVKNNMQMLHSLLRTAQREAEDAGARAVLANATDRIGAMAAAQQVLYRAGASMGYDARHFLEAVCDSARSMLSRAVDLKIVACTEDMLSNDTAMPLALIIHELIVNAAKHGLNGRGKGTIRVSLTSPDESYHLTVEDDGPGFVLDHVRKRSSGLGLVFGLARQLGGTLKVERCNGARCTVQFAEKGL